MGFRWFGDQARAELTVFDLRFDNQIVSIPGSNPRIFRNLGATTHDGVELAWDYDFDHNGPLAGLNVYANYAYVRAIQKSGLDEGKDVPYYSRQTGTLGARYVTGPWAFNLSTTRQSSQYSDAANTVEEPADARTGRVSGFSIWNLQATWKMPQWKGSEITMGINNLTDRRYYSRNVDSNPGRMVGAPRTVYLQASLSD